MKAILGAAFMAAVGAAEFIMQGSFLLIALYGAASPVTYVFYALDKNAARKGAWRIPEAQLHLLALIGGWPGAVFAQQSLRHKSKKPSFRFVFRLTVILNAAVAVWLLTPTGAVILTVLTGGSA